MWSASVVGVAVGVLIVAWAPAVWAVPLDTYDLIGEDPSGDSRHFIATGVADPTGLFTPARLDILSLEMGTEPEILHVKLNIATLPTGTSGYMYRVGFTVGETAYHTCWTLQSTGGRPEADQENTLGCSRFTTSTGVGPATRAAGVQAATEDDRAFIRWEVPRSAIGSPPDGVELSSVFAETWVRGVSTCCAGSQTSSQYMWNRADRAPDAAEEFLAYALGGGGGGVAPDLSVTVDEANRTVGPGSIVQFRLNASAPVTENSTVSFAADGIPAGWEWRAVEPDVRVGAERPWARGDLRISVQATAENGTYAFVALASIRGTNSTASVNLTVTVDSSVVATTPPDETPSSPTPSQSAAPDNETGNATTLDDPDAAAIPAGGIVLSVGAALAALVVARRTHGRRSS